MSYQEAYTKFPNRYNDIIKPRLTGVQRDVCDVVIRLTWGWHKESAAISNATFAAKTGRSLRGIIAAKNALLNMGLLVIVAEGKGTKANSYRLDLRYDMPEPGAAEIAPETPPVEPVAVEPEPEPKAAQDATTEAPEPVTESAASIPEAIPTPEPEVEAVSTENESCATSAENAPALLDLNLSTKENKQTEATEQHETSVEKKNTTGTVCFKFLSIFPEAKAADDWKFFGWATTKHGVETCIAQLEYMQEFKSQGHKIRNPRAFLRMALRANYQLPEYVQEKIKGNERAKLARERSQKESEERRTMTANFNYGSAAAACQKVMDMLG